MAIASINANTNAKSFDTPVVAVSKDDAGSAERFLKLLVAQMQNQDPLNPMDNAQVTSQMAQINTVSGIEKLNTTVKGLSAQFSQLQTLQGASLVGRDVIVPGDKLDIDKDAAVGQGGYELSGPADNVQVDVLSPSGQLLDTIKLGAQGSGMHSFDWPAGAATNDSALRFRVTATLGSVSSVAKPLMRDHVNAVTSDSGGSSFNVELKNSGSLPYSSVRAFN